jgi:hypothetical protein
MIRRISHAALNVEAAKSLVPYQDLESKQLLHGFLHAPNDFVEHIHRYANSVITQIVWGWRSATHDDPRVKKVYEKVTKQSALVSSAPGPLLDLYPALRLLPDFMIPIRKKGHDLHMMEKKMYIDHYLAMKTKVKSGKPMVCIPLAIAYFGDNVDRLDR